jgi:hypothetical protein
MRAITTMANDYDIGVYSLPAVNFNTRHALPNKLFEFIQARLAVAIGPSPEMAEIVTRYGCGVVAKDFEPESLADELNRLDDTAIAHFKAASNAAAAELSAERNSGLIVRAVEEALSADPSEEDHPRLQGRI